MRSNKHCWGVLILLLYALISCTTQPLTTANKMPPVSSISVVMDNNYPPYAFVDDKGSLQGILVDQWKLWEERTGVKVDIVGLPWGDALDQMKAGNFDVIDTIFYTSERSKIFDYTKPYAEINVRIFFRENISGIANAQNLKGFRVAVKAGDANAEYLLGEGVTSLVYYDSYEEIVEATVNNEENIFVVDEPPALYFLYRNNIQDQFSYSEPLYSGEFHRAVKKGDTAILELVNQGFSNISAEEYEEINNRWFGVTQTNELSRIMPYLGAGIALALLIIVSLTTFNRTLQTRVRKRTKEVEEALAHLKESEALFRDSIEFLPIPIGIANADGKIIELNNKFTEHYGYTIEDTPTISKWIDTAYPDPIYRQEAAAQWDEDVAKALADNKNTTPREYLVTGKNSSLHNIEIMMHPTGELWVTSFVEITERKKTEENLRKSKERYRAVVDNQTEFIARCKIDGTRTFVNDAYCRYFGITREDAIGTSFHPQIVEEDLAALKEKISRLASGPADVETDIHRAIKPDGSIGWQEWTDQVIRDDAGRVIEIQSVGRDITNRKQAEEDLHKAYESTLWGWAKALEYRDKETEGHSRRVVEITRALSLAMGISDENELTSIRRGAILHDIGKLAIPDNILLKPGVLTAKEWDIMCQHPRLGYEMLSKIDYLNDSLGIIISHHEKWDGSGYPKGLKGEEIPFAARIFSIVDVWDAVQSNRPYKKAWSREDAIAYLESNAGKLFDANIIKVFLKLAAQGEI